MGMKIIRGKYFSLGDWIAVREWVGVLPRICLANAGEGQMRLRCATSGRFTPQSIETSDAKRCTSSTEERIVSLQTG
jgi:hypothetical protein